MFGLKRVEDVLLGRRTEVAEEPNVEGEQPRRTSRIGAEQLEQDIEHREDLFAAAQAPERRIEFAGSGGGFEGCAIACSLADRVRVSPDPRRTDKLASQPSPSIDLSQ